MTYSIPALAAAAVMMAQGALAIDITVGSS